MRSLGLLALISLAAYGQQRESLIYSINWPSGLSLGEASIISEPSGQHVDLSLKLEAAIPGFPLRDEFRSRMTTAFCSLTFEKDSTHGTRVADERSTFNAETNTLTRETSGGGKAQTAIGPCAKDALAFLFFLRKELAQGRIPPPQKIYFGAAYQANLKFVKVEKIRVGEQLIEADKLGVALTGPASTTTFEISFARDAQRTPLVIRAQFAMGSFSMELVP